MSTRVLRQAAPIPIRHQDRRRPLLIGAGVLVALLVVAVVIALARGAGSTDGSGEALATAPVSLEGSPLPAFETGVVPSADPAVGSRAPIVYGSAPDGSPASIGGSGDGPALIVFLAHWCPHCQAEVPVLVDLAATGGLDGVRVVAVLTGTNEAAPNYPPAAWLEREAWFGEVLVDDDASRAGGSYGLTSYPYLVAVDAEGSVTARGAGELGPDAVLALVATAR